MLFGSSKKSSAEPGMLALQIVLSALLFLSTLAGVIGVVLAHVDFQRGTMSFGTTTGSLSLLAFAVTATLWGQHMKALMCVDAPTPSKKK